MRNRSLADLCSLLHEERMLSTDIYSDFSSGWEYTAYVDDFVPITTFATLTHSDVDKPYVHLHSSWT